MPIVGEDYRNIFELHSAFISLIAEKDRCATLRQEVMHDLFKALGRKVPWYLGEGLGRHWQKREDIF